MTPATNGNLDLMTDRYWLKKEWTLAGDGDDPFDHVAGKGTVNYANKEL